MQIYLHFGAQVHDLRGDLDPLLQAIQNALGIVELEILNTHCTFAIKFFCKANMNLTSLPPFVLVFPVQKRCEHTITPRHWSGFFNNLDAARAHCVLE